MPSIRGQVADLTGQDGVVRHPFVNKPDHADMVDEVGETTAAIQLADRSVISDQGKA